MSNTILTLKSLPRKFAQVAKFRQIWSHCAAAAAGEKWRNSRQTTRAAKAHAAAIWYIVWFVCCESLVSQIIFFCKKMNFLHES